MFNYKKKKKNICNPRRVPLTAVVLMHSVFGFTSNRHSITYCHRAVDVIAPNGLSPPQKQFAFPWFRESAAEKNDDDPQSPAESYRSEKQAESLSDTADIVERFKSSHRIGKQTETALQELSFTYVEGSAADGKIKVIFNGQQIPLGVEIDETYLKDVLSEKGDEGVDKLCSALADAMRDAHYKSGIHVEEKMKSLYSDLDFESE